MRYGLLVLLLGICPVTQAAANACDPKPGPYEASDRIFADFVLDAHIPGLVYGVVADGKLVHVGCFGVQDLESRKPVDAETLFRIASMTKAFTALTVLHLRDQGRLRLDEPAEKYVPQMRGWTYPTKDSPRIRVRDLLNHTAGFVTDDPWGDRQTPLPEAEFTQLLQAGVPFTRAPQTAFEYSNLGFALLGRIIGNVSRHPYPETITRTLLRPLGMDATGFVAEDALRERRALGYRWEFNGWHPEPVLGPGAFGAMGGIQTSARDYARWVAFLLAAWPPRDDPDTGPVARATVRELAQGSNFVGLRAQAGHNPGHCQQATAYGMGFGTIMDCKLGFVLAHGGGYPGYGSHVLLLPNRGVGIFAFANRTYAESSVGAWNAALALDAVGALGQERALPVIPALAAAYRAAGEIYGKADITAAGDVLAMNVLLDHSREGWARRLSELREQVGECDPTPPPTATGQLTAEFTWRCAHGRLHGELELAPTQPPRIQVLELEPEAP